MTPEARQILEVFRSRDLGAGGFVHATDFGSALVWKDGFVRDESVRQALQFLIDGEYVLQMNAGLELTAKGASV